MPGGAGRLKSGLPPLEFISGTYTSGAENGTFLWRRRGRSWEVQEALVNGGNVHFNGYDIAKIGTKRYLALSSNNSTTSPTVGMLSTDNGRTWEPTSYTKVSGGTVVGHQIAVRPSDGRIVVISGGGGGGRLITSDDHGVSWTETKTGGLGNAGTTTGGVIYASHLNAFFAAWCEGTGLNKVYRSDDGFTWTEVFDPSYPGEIDNFMLSIAYDGTRVAFYNQIQLSIFDASPTMRTWYSTDGVAWTEFGRNSGSGGQQIYAGLSKFAGHGGIWLVNVNTEDSNTYRLSYLNQNLRPPQPGNEWLTVEGDFTLSRILAVKYIHGRFTVAYMDGTVKRLVSAGNFGTTWEDDEVPTDRTYRCRAISS